MSINAVECKRNEIDLKYISVHIVIDEISYIAKLNIRDYEFELFKITGESSANIDCKLCGMRLFKEDTNL